MRNTRYNKLLLVLTRVKDWGEFSKVGANSPKASRKNTDFG